MKIAKITNIALANAAMAQLVNRQDGLPGLGVLYGPSGYGKTTATVAVANQTRAYYVQLRSAWTRKTFMEKVCVELGVEKGRNTAECCYLVRFNCDLFTQLCIWLDSLRSRKVNFSRGTFWLFYDSFHHMRHCTTVCKI